MNNGIFNSISLANVYYYKGVTKKKFFWQAHYSYEEITNKILNADSEEKVHECCSMIQSIYGFDNFDFVAIIPSLSGAPFTYYMYDQSSRWSEYYASNNYLVDDVRIPYALTKVTPSFWGDGIYCDAQNRKLNAICNINQKNTLDLAYNNGQCRMTSFPIFGSQGDCGVFRLINQKDGTKPKSEKELKNDIAQINMLMCYLYESLLKLIQKHQNESTSDIHLTNREEEILKWVASGKSNINISSILNISENTVAKHMKSIHKKLGVKSRQHAVARAISNNLILV